MSAVLFVPESPVRTPGRISWLPALLLSGWLVALLLGVGMYATFAFLPEFVQTPAASIKMDFSSSIASMSSDLAEVPLVGGHPALDLVNTVAPREVLPDGSQPDDRLTSPPALLAWARRARFADPEESGSAARAWQRDPGAGAAALDGVRDLRDSLHITLLDAAGLVPQPPGLAAAALQRLHGRWVAAVARSALRVDRDAARPLRLAVGLTPDLQIQDRIAAAVMDLLLTVDYRRLRRCPPEDGGCGFIVLDQSRNGSRRWCQMADCGSASKARRLTERRRASRLDTPAEH